jgi:hypothetical protein
MTRIIWTGKGDAISKQVQAMARRQEQDIDPTAPNYNPNISKEAVK